MLAVLKCSQRLGLVAGAFLFLLLVAPRFGASSSGISVNKPPAWGMCPFRGWEHIAEMQIGYRFDNAIVTVRFFGEYALEDAKAALLAVMPDLKSAHVRGTLVDVSESWSFMARSQVELDSIGGFVASVRERLGGRMAVLARTEMTYDMACVVGTSASKQGLPVRIFRKEEAARAWLHDRGSATSGSE